MTIEDQYAYHFNILTNEMLIARVGPFLVGLERYPNPPTANASHQGPNYKYTLSNMFVFFFFLLNTEA